MSAIELEYVIGVSPSAGVHSLPSSSSSTSTSPRIAYVAGNVAVIFDPSTRSQTLLRAHRNRISSSALSPCGRLLATACAGRDSSVVLWAVADGSADGDDAAGVRAGEALAMIEAPHEAGSAALDFSPCGRFLCTLSMPLTALDAERSEAKTKEDSERGKHASDVQRQEVAVWDVASVFDLFAAASTSPSPTLLCRAPLSRRGVAERPQTQLRVSQFPAPPALAVGVLRDPPALGSGLLTAAIELITSGPDSVTFWVATCCAQKDEAAGAELRRQLKLRLGAKQPSEADLAEVAEKARSATRDLWRLTAASPSIPVLPASIGGGGGASVPHRLVTSSCFLRGELAPALLSVDEIVAALDASVTASGTLGKISVGAVGKEMMLPPTGASASAASTTGDGSIILWKSSLNSGVVTTIAALASSIVNREVLKIVKLTKPESALSEPSVNATPGRTPDALNQISPTPSGRHIVVGADDGAVRVYDLNMRLVGHFESIAAGPIVALSFSSVKAQAHTALSSPRLRDAVPNLVLATSKALVVSLKMASFDAHLDPTFAPDAAATVAEAAKRGDILLEGPDASVVGMCALVDSPRLAVAVASGCVQLWDADRKSLLLVRELVRAPDQATDPLTGAARPRLYTPSCIVADPRGRFLAVGTSDSYTLLLDPRDLSDCQAVLTPPHWPRNDVTDGSITKAVFSPDGFHLALADEGRHVSLYRFTRSRERRLIPGADSSTATSRLASRRPWDSVVDDSEKYQEIVLDQWSFIGRARSHSREVTGLSFSPLQNAKGAGAASATGEVPGFSAASFWPAGVIVGERAVTERHATAGLSLLASVGRDARLVVYDVGSSSVSSGLQLRSGSSQRSKVEQFAAPCTAVFLPRDVPSGEAGNASDGEASEFADAGNRILISSDAYKFKLWSVGTGPPQCISTVLAPAFGGAVSALAFLPLPSTNDGPKNHYGVAYATSDRVVGVVSLPLTGNPFSAQGVVGHTGAVTSIAAQFNGRRFFTSGSDGVVGSGASSPGSVCVWAVSPDSLAQQTASGGTGVTPFLSLLESQSGEGGGEYAEICDLFSYAQVHAQGEHSSQPRRAGASLPVAELASVMRALGFFPTSEELGALLNEARRSSGCLTGSAAPSSEGVEHGSHEGDHTPNSTDSSTVDLSTLIRLFVNHRPVVPPSRAVAVRAVDAIMRHAPLRGDVVTEDELTGAKLPGGPSLPWRALQGVLATHGEPLSRHEVGSCLVALLGGAGEGDKGAHHIEPHIEPDALLGAASVADQILGLKE